MIKQDKPKVYVESSTISYLTARPTRNIIIAARQQLTHEWWNQQEKYELFISETVIYEIAKGDPKAAETRVEIVQDIPRLKHNDEVRKLAQAILRTGAVPEKAEADATHIAFSGVYGMDFLITWNQKHIATEKKRDMIKAIIEAFGFRPPRLFTPEAHMIYEET